MSRAPSDPIGRVVRDAINLQRVANQIGDEGNAILEALFDEIVAAIARIDPTAVSALTYRRDRVAKLLATVEELAGASMKTWHASTRSDLAMLGRVQGQRARDHLIATLGPVGKVVNVTTPSVNMMKAIIDRDPFQGETLKGWADTMEQAIIRRVRQQVQLGMSAEEPIDDIVRRVRGRHTGTFRTVSLKSGETRRLGEHAGGVLQTTTREATAIVRTAVSDVANTATLETFRQNPRVVAGVRWVAALDHRTCSICQERDGRVYELDGPVRPPAHYNCRCTIVAVIDWKRLGVDPPDEGTRAARGPDGQWTSVPSGTRYEDWLRAQPKAVQEEVLGKARAVLFRDGKMSLPNLIGSDGRYLTVAELEAAA